jgi:hypothetical protein
MRFLIFIFFFSSRALGLHPNFAQEFPGTKGQINIFADLKCFTRTTLIPLLLSVSVDQNQVTVER